mgnify:FL=1|jgi:hypothetical protein
MSDGSNPFSPSFGVTPRVLAGRDAALAAFRDSFSGGAGAPARTVLVVGSRGLGKTVMLNEFEDAALRAGWLAVSESSSPGLLQRLTRDHLPRLLREHARPRARLTGLSATPGPLDVGAAWEPGPPPESTLRAQINELTDRLADQGGGLALTVDEIQDADVAELRKIGEVLQFSRREGRALAFAGAGLRTGVGALVRSPGATFLRRAMRIDLRDLTGAQAGRALAGPAEEAGRPFDATALALATTVSRGYPYLVQAIGYCAWNASSGAAGITTAHVDRSLPEALGMYRANVLEQAWLDASPREREMLAVMAAISTTEPVSVAALSRGPRRRPAPGRRRRGTRRSRPARSRSGTRWPGT